MAIIILEVFVWLGISSALIFVCRFVRKFWIFLMCSLCWSFVCCTLPCGYFFFFFFCKTWSSNDKGNGNIISEKEGMGIVNLNWEFGVIISLLFQIFIGIFFCLCIFCFATALFWFGWLRCKKWKRSTPNSGKKISAATAFFHPSCEGGGGGERVLWSLIAELLRRHSSKNDLCKSGSKISSSSSDQNEQPLLVIYCKPSVSSSSSSSSCGYQYINKSSPLVHLIFDRFSIDLSPFLPESSLSSPSSSVDVSSSSSVMLVELHWWRLLEARCYPRFTMIGQSIGSMIVCLEALYRFIPSEIIDTTGYTFIFPVISFLLPSCRRCAYIHYPTISIDMLSLVQSGEVTYNNARWISASRFFTRIKLLYYHIFALLYRMVGSHVQKVAVNSTWTQNHIEKIWRNSTTTIVYPPCDLNAFKRILGKEEGEGEGTTAAARKKEEDERGWSDREMRNGVCEGKTDEKEGGRERKGGEENGGGKIGVEKMKKKEKMHRENWIVSVAQFRPEKNQKFQLEIFRQLVAEYGVQENPQEEEEDEECVIDGEREERQLRRRRIFQNNEKEKERNEEMDSEDETERIRRRRREKGDTEKGGGRGGGRNFCLPSTLRFVMCGSTRNSEDACLLHSLQALCELEENRWWGKFVDFRINLSAEELLRVLIKSKVALHTMINEHFGISVVEFLAAGLIVVAHNSGGPKCDILKFLKKNKKEEEIVGFLAETKEEFVESLAKGLMGYDNSPEVQKMRKKGEKSLGRFLTNRKFAEKCIEVFDLH